MIAIDTNVLLRYLVQDDERQGALARQLLEDGLSPETPGFVTLVAVRELDWVLRDRYRFEAKTVARVLAGLMSASNLVFQDPQALEAALSYEHGDLADNILHHVGQERGCSQTLTFDKKFARLKGVKLLTA